ncbi:MAG: DUF721 domain-containing protein [Nitrospirae bacterium]|nr:DUF721 domain-containing protein [Nitrospirota bacterium]
MPKAPLFTPVNQILQRLIAQYGFEGPMAEHRLRERWAEVVGEQLAAHAQPDRIHFRKLYLSVDSPAWMQELVFLKPMLLEKVNAALCRFQADFRVEEILLRLGPTIPPVSSSSAPRNRPEP